MDNDNKTSREEQMPQEPAVICEVRENGSLLVIGNLEVRMPDGTVIVKGPRTSFCRCGASANKPFCDGAHRNVGFVG